MHITLLPPEIYPAFLYTPAEAVAARITCRRLLAAIPPKLFENVENMLERASWESPKYRVSIEVYRDNIHPAPIHITDFERLAPPTDDFNPDISHKYYVKFGRSYFFTNKLSWIRYVPELRPQIFVSYMITAGGGAVNPATFVGDLDGRDKITGVVSFLCPVETFGYYRIVFEHKFEKLLRLENCKFPCNIYSKMCN